MGDQRFVDGRSEPSLSEVMADPIVHAVMRRDGVTAEQLETLLRDASARIGERRCHPAALKH
jgi:hypothetical protein